MIFQQQIDFTQPQQAYSSYVAATAATAVHHLPEPSGGKQNPTMAT
jgi:hypothetical protein